MRRICIIVAGMHRSGTSALTRVVNLLGADISSTLLPPVPGDNDLGYWESIRILDIHDRLLLSLGSRYDDPLPLPERWTESEAALAARAQLDAEIEKDFGRSRLFVVKDPRITRLLPLWLSLLDQRGVLPIVILPFRNPLEVAESLRKRGEGFADSQSPLVYVRSYLEAEYASRERRRFFVRYDDLLRDWRIIEAQLRDLAGGLLPPLSGEVEAEIGRFLTFDLRSHSFTREDLGNASNIPDTAVTMFDMMVQAAHNGEGDEIRRSFDKLRATVEEATRLFRDFVPESRERGPRSVDGFDEQA